MVSLFITSADDDIPTATSLKNSKSNEREFPRTDPPILFNLAYRVLAG